MKNQELDQKRPTLLMMGLMASLSLTLCAFNWQTETGSLAAYNPLGLEGEAIEWDLPPVIILKSQPEPQAAAPSLHSAPSPVGSRNITLVPDLTPMPTHNGPMNKLSAIKPITRSNQGLKRDLKPLASTTHGIRQLQPQELPYMRTCGSITDPIERFQCTQVKLKKHVGSKFRVPSIYEMAALPSRVQVLFVIDEYGRIRDIQTEEKQHPIIMRELERVLGSCPEMVAASVAGQRVKVRFELPIVMSRVK
jgi:hypothetical protein